jgi:hypothetical protein
VEGCDEGIRTDLANRDPAFAFGGDLGQHFPTAISSDTIMMSPNLESLSAVRAAYQGDSPSLYDLPEIRVIVSALAERDGVVRYAQFTPPSTLRTDHVLTAEDMPTEEAAAIAATLDFSPMPVPSFITLVDMPTEEIEYSYVMLSYPSAAEAESTLEEMISRYETMPSIVRSGSTIQEIIASRGGSLSDSYVYESESGSSSVAVLVFENPQPEYEMASGGGTMLMLNSALVHRLFINMMLGRDVLWFAPDVDVE